MLIIRAALIFFVAILLNTPVMAEIKLNGFGSIYAGQVVEGKEFVSDFPNAGLYDRSFSFSPDSTLGLQFSSFFTDEFSLIAQIVVHGATDFDSEVDWLYLNYHLTPELSLQFGRKRLPLYYYSDYYDIGYAYNWVRPPADLYTWQITNYNGISLLYEKNIGEYDTSFNVYYGNEESDDNELLTLLFGVPVDEKWEDMFGMVTTLANEWIDLRVTYMQGFVVRDVNGVRVVDSIKQKLFGVSLNFTFDELLLLSEFNNYRRPTDDINVDTYMLSVGYEIGDFTPHITRSVFEQELNASGNDEKHQTTTFGVRWDIFTDIAVKLQYDKVIDDGVVVPVKGDSKTISLGMDFVF